jgi:hypothetical protein
LKALESSEWIAFFLFFFFLLEFISPSIRYHVELTISQSTWESIGVKEAFVGRTIDCITVVGKKLPTVILTLIARRDEATERHLKIEQISALAMRAYIEGDLVRALSYNEALLYHLEGDDERYSCLLLIERIQKLLLQGLPKEWNGSIAMTEK